MPITKADQAGRDLIIENEGLSYKAYQDSKGGWTTGIGHLILSNESYLKTQLLTHNQAMDIFNSDLAIREHWLIENCKWDNPIIQCEFNALCSFLFQYNIDNPKYKDTKQAILSGNRDKIVKQMQLFRSINPINHDMKLISRRMKEIAMFKNTSE